MIEIQSSACDYLRNLLLEAEAPSGVTIRLESRGAVLTLRLDHANCEDATFEAQGRMILALEPRLATLLKDCRLEVTRTGNGPCLLLSE